jgi:hypothetical protein
MIKKKFKIPLYFHNLTIIQTDDFQAIEKMYKVTDLSDDYAAVVFENSQSIVMVCDFKVTPSIIAHEAVHIVNSVFLTTGMELDRINDEAQAYLTGWIVEKIHSVVKIAKTERKACTSELKTVPLQK